jgi:hypothetical protein
MLNPQFKGAQPIDVFVVPVGITVTFYDKAGRETLVEQIS